MKRYVFSVTAWLLLAATTFAQGIIGGGIIGGGGNLFTKLGPTQQLESSSGVFTDAAIQFVADDKSALAMATNFDPGTDDFIISFWMYVPALPSGYGAVISTANAGNAERGFRLLITTDGSMLLQLDSGAAGSVSGSVISSGITALTWHQISVVFDRSASATGYLNGVQKQSVSLAGHTGSLGATHGYLGATKTGSVFDNYWLGASLDSFFIFKAADLSSVASTIISWAYNSGAGRLATDITTAQKTAWGAISAWDLGEASGTRYDAWGDNDLTPTFASIIAPPIIGSELLGNTGFETAGAGGADVFANWSEVVTGSTAISAETSDVYAGSKACKIVVDGSSSYAIILQGILTVGNTYSWSFWAKTDAGSPTVRVNIGSGTAVDKTLTTSWAKYSGESVATSSVNFAIAPQSSIAGRTILIDAVSVKQITTAAINAGGFESWTTTTNAATWSESLAGTSAITREDTAVYHGSHSVKMVIDASGSKAAMQLANNLTVGKTYSYSFYAKGGAGSEEIRVGTATTYNTETLTTDYAAQTGTFIADTTTFEISCVTASATVYIDSLTELATVVLPSAGIVRGLCVDEDDVSFWESLLATGDAQIETLAHRPVYDDTTEAFPIITSDGVDDRLTTAMVPGDAGTIVCVLSGGATGDVYVGASHGTEAIAIANTAGVITATAGDGSPVLTSDEDPTTGFRVVVFSHAGASGAQFLMVDGTVEDTDTQVGTLSITETLYLFCENDDGTAADFAEASIARAYYLQQAISQSSAKGITARIQKALGLSP